MKDGLACIMLMHPRWWVRGTTIYYSMNLQSGAKLGVVLFVISAACSGLDSPMIPAESNRRLTQTRSCLTRSLADLRAMVLVSEEACDIVPDLSGVILWMRWAKASRQDGAAKLHRW